MKIQARPRFQLRTILLGIAGAILAWLVVSRSLGAYLADVAPQTALWLDPQQPQALVNLADRSVNASVSTNALNAEDRDQGPENTDPGNLSSTSASGAGTSDQIAGGGTGTKDSSDDNLRKMDRAFEMVNSNRSIDLAAVRAWAESALLRGPLNARALRILGQVADAGGNAADVLKFMSAATKQSLHESIAVYWMMRKSAEGGDYKTAVFYADALLRTNPGLAPFVVPLLAHFAEQPASKELINQTLEGNPPWRNVFFEYLPSGISDARTPLDLLLALRTSPAPPDAKEIDDYLSILIAHKFYDLAYYAWLQFLPPDQLRSAGLLFNGDFEVRPSGSPFDWTIKQGSGVTIDIVPTPDKAEGHALLIEFLFGRVDYHSVSELVLLAPGTYRFDGQYKGKIAGPRGMKWRLVCAGEAETRIGESPMISGVTPAWKDVHFIFTVPATDCRAQYVRLDLDARMASEQLVSGAIMFDELHISRGTDPQSTQQSNN
jgi:hypothetical protein